MNGNLNIMNFPRTDHVLVLILKFFPLFQYKIFRCLKEFFLTCLKLFNSIYMSYFLALRLQGFLTLEKATIEYECGVGFRMLKSFSRVDIYVTCRSFEILCYDALRSPTGKVLNWTFLSYFL